MELPLAAGTVLGLAVAGVNFVAYREAVARMALDPSAYVIPEVSRYGLGSRPRRTGPPGQLAARHPARVDDARKLVPGRSRQASRPQLEGLAADLARPHVSIRPASAVACRRLLTCGAESPLYNPRIPSNELSAVLLRIRHGIGYERADAASRRESPDRS